MKLYATEEFADEGGPLAEEFKTAYIRGSKKELLGLCSFFKEVEKQLKIYDNFHQHFRDFSQDWDKDNSIDIDLEITK